MLISCAGAGDTVRPKTAATPTATVARRTQRTITGVVNSFLADGSTNSPSPARGCHKGIPVAGASVPWALPPAAAQRATTAVRSAPPATPPPSARGRTRVRGRVQAPAWRPGQVPPGAARQVWARGAALLPDAGPSRRDFGRRPRRTPAGSTVRPAARPRGQPRARGEGPRAPPPRARALRIRAHEPPLRVHARLRVPGRPRAHARLPARAPPPRARARVRVPAQSHAAARARAPDAPRPARAMAVAATARRR